MYSDFEVKPALEQAVSTAIMDLEELLHTLRLIEEYIPQLPDKLTRKTTNKLYKMSEALYERPWYYDGAGVVDALLSKIIRTIPEQEEKAWLSEKIDRVSALLERMKALPDDPELKSIGEGIYHEDSLRNLDQWIGKYESFTKV